MFEHLFLSLLSSVHNSLWDWILPCSTTAAGVKILTVKVESDSEPIFANCCVLSETCMNELRVLVSSDVLKPVTSAIWTIAVFNPLKAAGNIPRDGDDYCVLLNSEFCYQTCETEK